MAFPLLQTLFRERGEADYIGEPVTQRQHMLLAAHAATRQGARPAVVVAALLHDVGHLLDDHPAMGNLGVHSHEQVGSQYLQKLGLSTEVCQLVAQHVAAKRYLVTTRNSPRLVNRLSFGTKVAR
jgi:putative nucleotidyltransferase with HDIG domain